MGYNVCETCGAKDGRAGLLLCLTDSKGNKLPNECLNCSDSRKSNTLTLYANLRRTDEEIKLMTYNLFGNGRQSTEINGDKTV